MSEEYKKPIPEIQPWTVEFWKASKQHKLLIQECQDCKARIFYPKKVCPKCWSSNLGWIESSGKGKVHTFTVMIDMVERKFSEDLPFVLAMVDVEEGIRMVTRIVDCPPESVRIDMPVEVTFKDISDECALPFFKPVSSSNSTRVKKK